MMTGIVSGRVLWSSMPLTFLCPEKKEVVTRTFFLSSYIRRLTTAAVAALK
jgi:hypothetical protein